MPVAHAGPTPAPFEIKSANLPVMALLLKTAELETLAQALEQRYADMPNFFDGDPLVIDLSTLPSEQAEAALDFAALQKLLHARRLSPVAVCGGSAAHHQAAQQAGLLVTQDRLVAQRRNQEAASKPVAEAPPARTGSLVLDKPVRSGQQVYARGADLVLMAAVNPGAEVIADGHIHVYAPLRGRAIAGARGDTTARIFALHMQPELVSIAGVYRSCEVPLEPDVWQRPGQIHLASGEQGDKLIVSPIQR